ncbi:MAG TPA: transketolase [Clostridia bacterium]|nr:transketolase [Clostridia bacterium]
MMSKSQKNYIEIPDILVKKVRRDILRMVHAAGSGHIGGSLSSADIYIALYHYANISPEMATHPDRDIIIASHGHTSAGLYSVLGNMGYFDVEEAVAGFRRGTIYEGHPSTAVPGVEWCSGSLGQGLSVACGFALASKILGKKNHVYVVMGDGEQAKGQLAEAREFAAKYHLDNLTAVIDYNRLQASGTLSEVMPQDIESKYRAAGWETVSIDGHDYAEIIRALGVRSQGKPVMVLAHTIMGKGVKAIENDYEYHGKLLSAPELETALAGLDSAYKNDGVANRVYNDLKPVSVERHVNPGARIIYTHPTDCRSAFGNCLYSLCEKNAQNAMVKIAAIDCDLVESVKLAKLKSKYPDSVIECGIAEHNAVSVAAGMSRAGVLTFFADFGVFGVDETYSQHRMADINHSSIKLVCSHCGLDVGEDGKTHQCIDYIGVMRNLFGYKILIPADANQTDAMVRYMAVTEGNIMLAAGRSKLPIVCTREGKPYYDEGYTFRYGKADWLREGEDACIITCGTLVANALTASDNIRAEGINAAVLNISCPCELDAEAIAKAAKTGRIITYEDHSVHTGLGSIVCAHMAENGLSARVVRMGVARYGSSAAPEAQFSEQGLDTDSLINKVKQIIEI